MTNDTLHRSLATWLDTKAEVSYQTDLSGDRSRVSILLHDIRCSQMGDSETAVSGRGCTPWRASSWRSPATRSRSLDPPRRTRSPEP